MVLSPDRACPEQPKHSRVSLPFAGCFVCELWILPNARCLPFVSPLAIVRDPRPSEGLFYHDPVPSPVPCHLLHTSSCPTILCVSPSSSKSLRYPRPRPWYSCDLHRCAPSPPFRLSTRPVDLLSHPRLHFRSRPRLHSRNLSD